MSTHENQDQFTRRNFLRKSAELAGAAALTPSLLTLGCAVEGNTIEAATGPIEAVEPAVQGKRSHADLVRLGKSNVKITRMGLGTGTKNGRIQRDLGQDGFTKLVHYCYDKGVRYIDTADQYNMHDYVNAAIKGLPREKLFIQTKMRWIEDDTRLNPMKHLDRFRKEVNTDYFDSVLIHCTTKHNWPEECKIMMDAFDEAQHKGWLKLKGMSCHGLASLKVATNHDWIQLQLARINPQGRYVDGDAANVHAPQGKPEIALKEIKAMHDKGRGIIGMKICGEGDFKDAADREKAIRYAMTCGYVDAIVIGFGSIAEVDEAIERVNKALA